MPCYECIKRYSCVIICTKVENILSKECATRRELPLEDKKLFFLVEDHLQARKAPYKDRHSAFLPELQRRMDRLPNRQRAVIELRYLELLSIKEIATKLKISYKTAYERLQVALKIYVRISDLMERIA